MLIIPAIDIIDGKVVRLIEGNFDKATTYSNSPIDQAKIFSDKNFEWIHIVDLEGSLSSEVSTISILNKIKNNTGLKIEFGGGIRSAETAGRLIEAGVDRLIIGSLSILDKKNFENIIVEAGRGSVIAAVDVINESVFIKGWTENSGISIYDHIDYCKSLGITKFLCTDITKDGKLEHPNFDLYKKLRSEEPAMKIIASGGVSTLSDIEELKKINVYAVVVGKAIYENKISLLELKNFD